MAVGKTYDFAQAQLAYYTSGTALPTHTGIYIALLSAVPAGSEPYYASAVSAAEFSAGQYRAQVTPASWGDIEPDLGNEAATVSNDSASVDFGNCPANVNVSGYAICINQTSLAASAIIGYETFTGSSASKARAVQADDTVKINNGQLTIKER